MSLSHDRGPSTNPCVRDVATTKRFARLRVDAYVNEQAAHFGVGGGRGEGEEGRGRDRGDGAGHGAAGGRGQGDTGRAGTDR